MKALLGFAGCCLSIAAAGLPAFGATDPSATADRSEIASVADVQTHPLDFDRAGWGIVVPMASSSSTPCGDAGATESPATLGNKTGDDSGIQPVDATPHAAKPADFNREIYY